MFCFHTCIRCLWFLNLSSNSIHVGGKTINFQNSYFKITARTQRRVVEGCAVVRFSVADVFVHPYCLTFPSSYRNHFTIGSHEQFRTVGHVPVSLHTNPRVFRPFWIQREQKCFSGTEVSLSIASVIFLVPFAPSGRTVCSKYLVVTSLNHKQRWFVLFHSNIERR